MILVFAGIGPVLHPRTIKEQRRLDWARGNLEKKDILDQALKYDRCLSLLIFTASNIADLAILLPCSGHCARDEEDATIPQLYPKEHKMETQYVSTQPAYHFGRMGSYMTTVRHLLAWTIRLEYN